MLLTHLEPDFFLIHFYEAIVYIGILVMLFYMEDRWAYMIGILSSIIWLVYAYVSGILSDSVRRIAAARWPFSGASDHGVSEALYLSDPDGLGIELYADRPRELWEGQVRERMTTLPLDVENLLAELDDPAVEPFDGLPDRTAVGHVHLRVADVDATVEV